MRPEGGRPSTKEGNEVWLRRRVLVRVPVMGRLDGVTVLDGDGGGGVEVVETLAEDEAAVESLL